ncbi:MAG: 23S rRNA (adenine(2503)-C(2))-methyltransferase RlmN [Patescibacteria group bacterium]|nr:23S rRNA (adenine(2503)-C(2))-methyltransferase RlmN [Patescibacteria group bacterium]
MLPLLDPPHEPLAQWLMEQGLPAYRLRQVLRWVFRQRAGSFEAMTDLPAGLRQKMAEAFHVFTSRVAQHQKSPDGTEKLLLALADGQQVECVLLRNDRGHQTACISTQVGCGMGCAFCASGLSGLVRNLTSGEILEQLLHLGQRLPAEERLTHVVVMGMGEPLANLDSLLPSLAVATSPDGLGISVRRITISTVGLPGGIRRLAQLEPPYHLAISLHAPDDPLRNRLVPANRAVGVQAVVEAADEYFAQTGRRVTYEYVLLAGENDQPSQASQLAHLLQGCPVLVNLIALNPVADLPFRGSDTRAVGQFKAILERAGVQVQVRLRKGECIDAACGQLRRRAGAGNATAEGV